MYRCWWGATPSPEVHGSDLAACIHETCILQIGWINFSHEKSHLESGDYGAGVTFSVAVQEDFTWTITYKKQIVPRTNSLLKNIPTCINSGKIYKCLLCSTIFSLHKLVSKLTNLLEVVGSSWVCRGNSNRKYLDLPNMRNKVLMNAASKYNDK